jgi:hypothetical protein
MSYDAIMHRRETLKIFVSGPPTPVSPSNCIHQECLLCSNIGGLGDETIFPRAHIAESARDEIVKNWIFSQRLRDLFEPRRRMGSRGVG